MSWSICELSLPKKARVRERDIDYIAVTAGNCTPSVCELSLPKKAQIRERDIDFIAVPVFTEVQIAELSLPKKARVRERDIDFIAVAIDCTGVPLKMECSPIKLTMSGSADFGDFSLEMDKTYLNNTSSYDTTDTGGQPGSWARGSSREYRRSYFKAGRHAFFDANPSNIIGESQMSGKIREDSNWQGYDEDGSYNENWTDENDYPGSLRSYKRGKATVSPDSTWVPIDFLSENRYLNTFVGAAQLFHHTFHENMTMPFSNVVTHADHRRVNHGIGGRTDIHKINYKTIDKETQVPGIFYKGEDNFSYNQHLMCANNNGNISSIPYYCLYSDVTYKGDPIDIGRIPTPCHFVSDAIIKIDGSAPSIVKSNYWSVEDSYNNSWYSDETYPLAKRMGGMDDGFYPEIVPFVETSTATGSGIYRAFNFVHSGSESSSYYYIPWTDEPARSGSSTYTVNNTLTKPSELGMFHGSLNRPVRADFNWQRSMKFVLQLGPIYKRVYNTEVIGALGYEGIELTGHSNANEYELEYIGFGWGIYLINPFPRHNSSNNEPQVWGPFSYSTHLSNYFEYNDELKYPEFKDVNYDTEDELREVLEDFNKQPNEVTFTKSEHKSGLGSGVLNYYAVLPYFFQGDGGNTYYYETEYEDYGESWVGLNPFGTPQITVTDYSEKKPPNKFKFHYLYIFDSEWTHLKTKPENDPIFDFPLYLSKLSFDKTAWDEQAGNRFDRPIAPFIEYNWDHRKEEWLFSIDSEHTHGLSWEENDGGTTGYNEDGDDILTYSIEATNKKMPTGSITIEELQEIDEDGNQWKISVTWNQPDWYDEHYEYRSPFKDGRKTINITTKVPPIIEGEPYFVFTLDNGVNISNISPDTYRLWVDQMSDMKDELEAELEEGDPPVDMSKVLREVGWEPIYVGIE